MNEFDSSTVRIPVRIRNGAITFFYAGALPKIREGAVGDLVLDKVFIEDETDLRRLQFQEDRELLPANVVLRAAVSPKGEVHGAIRRSRDDSSMDEGQATHVVEIKLLEPLVLRLRGTKRGVLRPVRCAVPALKQEKPTLNQAYALVAANFEPWRASTSGNVFKKVFYPSMIGSEVYWRKLEALRDAAEADLESRLFTTKGRSR